MHKQQSTSTSTTTKSTDLSALQRKKVQSACMHACIIQQLRCRAERQELSLPKEPKPFHIHTSHKQQRRIQNLVRRDALDPSITTYIHSPEYVLTQDMHLCNCESQASQFPLLSCCAKKNDSDYLCRKSSYRQRIATTS